MTVVRLGPDLHDGGMHNIECGGRPGVLDTQSNEWSFVWGNQFSPGRSVTGQFHQWISNIEHRGPVEKDKRAKMLTSGALLSESNPEKSEREGRQKDGQDRDNGVSDFALAYKFLSPFAWIIWASACAIIGRRIYVGTDSRVGEYAGTFVCFTGIAGAFCGMWAWALRWPF